MKLVLNVVMIVVLVGAVMNLAAARHYLKSADSIRAGRGELPKPWYVRLTERIFP